MERKIGEIFEYNGEWYQCVESKQDVCTDCAFNPINGIGYNCCGSCTYKQVISKKLEKVGEPYVGNNGTFQSYKLAMPIYGDIPDQITGFTTTEVVIKQNKEDMEENKTPLPKEDNALTRTVYAYVNGKISDKELIRSIKEMSDEYPYDKDGLKPFSLELAKQGKPVCTRDGRKARIICFDAKGSMPIVALISNGDYENLHRYYNSGSNYNVDNNYDLMMLPEKKEGWIIVSKNAIPIYDSLEDAKKSFDSDKELCICKAEWEE